jgi:uncharacterized OB-fold protein
MPLEIQVCDGCGHAVFPSRLACSRCGSTSWRSELAEQGAVEHVTVVRRSPVIDAADLPVRLGLVRTDVGPVVIARIDERTEAGHRVRMSSSGNAVVAHRIRRSSTAAGS